MIAGIDEAGRGPVLGPLVVAAVLAPDQARLRRLGVKDSKALSPEAREALLPRIHETATRVEVRVVDVEELDARMATRTLNDIEASVFAELLARLAPDEAILDACDTDAARFGRTVAARVQPSPAEVGLGEDAGPAARSLARCTFGGGRVCVVRSEHGADARPPVVAAASIVAKVERDRRMAALHETYGPCGSGYSSDPATQAFLRRWFEEHGTLPPCARRHWQTARRYVPTNRTLF